MPLRLLTGRTPQIRGGSSWEALRFLAFSIGNTGATGNWLHLGSTGSVRQPLERSAAVGAASASSYSSPLRSQVMGRDQTSLSMAQDRAVASLTSQASQVRSEIASLDFPSGELIQQIRIAQSSNPNYWTGSAASDATQTSHLAQVVGLSLAQRNQSIALGKPDQSAISAETYTLELTEGDYDPVSFDITVDYSEPFGDSNTSILEKLGRAIETVGRNLETELVYGTTLDDEGLEIGTVALAISTRNTGPEGHFTIADTTGTLAADLKLNRRVQGGQDLTYLQGTQRATPYEQLFSDFRSGEAESGLTAAEVWDPPLASPEIRRSKTLDPDGTSDLAAGLYKFQVGVGNDTREVDFSIDYHSYSPDRNWSILDSLALAIETAAPELKAQVTIGEASDADDQPTRGATLTVANRNPGVGEGFFLQDVSGDLIHTLNLDRTYRPAQATQPAFGGYGGNRVSDRFGLDTTRLQTQAHQTFMDRTKLSVTPAAEPIVNRVESIATAHNRFLSTSEANRNLVTPTVGRRLASDLYANQESYSRIGVDVSSSGRISVKDSFDDRLVEETSTVRDGLTGSSGLLSVIDRGLESALGRGFDSYRTKQGGIIFNPPGATSTGFDYFARAQMNIPSRTATSLAVNKRAALLSKLA